MGLVTMMAKGINGFPSLLWGNIRHAPGLKIRPGQILTGTTLEVSAGKAVLLLQGINVVAELETTLIPGERVALEVEDLAPGGKILLKKLNLEENKGDQRIDRQELKTVLQHFGLQQGKLNRAIVAQILRGKLPLSGPLLQQLTGFAAANALSSAEVPALIWLWSKNLPLTRETVAAIHNLMENGPDSSSLQIFFDALSEIPAGETENTGLRHLFEEWRNLPVTSNDTPAIAADKVGALIDRLGLNYERAIRQLTVAGEKPNLGNPSQDTSQYIIGNTAKNIETSLKHALLKLTQSPGSRSAPIPGELARGMLEEITGLQLLNISGQQETAEGSSIFLAAWASIPEEKLLPLFLKIKRYNQRREDTENPFYQIFFLLNTRHLGQIICRLALEKEHLACGFTVRGRQEKKLMDGYLGFLRQRLEYLPWCIVLHPTKVTSTEGIKHSWREEFFTSSPGRVKILDTRV